MRVLRTLWNWHGPLTAFAAAMVTTAVVACVAWSFDDRTLVGQPIWAKPVKFSLSFTAYATTLAWLLSLLPRARRVAWWTGTVVAAASTAEMAAIVGQVMRGRQSHFDVATPLDAAIFSAMGVLVAVIFLGTLTAAVLVLRDPTGDPALTRAVRLGVLITLAGMSVGFLMLRATPEQAQAAQAAIVGAHSVGVADGGPALPLLGWSTTGGDLRVGHFLGLHALQALPLLALALGTRRARHLHDRTRTRIVSVAAAAYSGIVVITVWQALRGQPVTAPDGVTLLALGTLLALTALSALAVVRTARPALPSTP